MDYYEELGINRFAQADEIRKAHRRFSKLVHPDQHVDPVLKGLAETQMRRLNAIAAVLLQPEKRRQYDIQQMMPEMTRARGLSIGPRAYANQSRPAPRPVRSSTAEAAIRAGFRTNQEVFLWSMLSASVAVLLTLCAVWAWGSQRFSAADAAYTASTPSRGSVNSSASRCEPTPAERALLDGLTGKESKGKQSEVTRSVSTTPGISRVNFSPAALGDEAAPADGPSHSR